jgi:hypothetical protein
MKLKACTEFKPPMGTEVIVYDTVRDIYRIAQRIKRDEYWYDQAGNAIVTGFSGNPLLFTHWCELPTRN